MPKFLGARNASFLWAEYHSASAERRASTSSLCKNTKIKFVVNFLFFEFLFFNVLIVMKCPQMVCDERQKFVCERKICEKKFHGYIKKVYKKSWKNFADRKIWLFKKSTSGNSVILYFYCEKPSFYCMVLTNEQKTTCPRDIVPRARVRTSTGSMVADLHVA